MVEDVVSIATAAGTIATAVAVVVGVLHLRTAKRELELAQRNAQTAFEDDLSREYRSIVAELPPEAFYREQVVELNADVRRTFFRYFDLSNEQLFLAANARVSHQTTRQWMDGIAGNLRLPSFEGAWHDMLPHLPDDFFEDLRAFSQREVWPRESGARDGVADRSPGRAR